MLQCANAMHYAIVSENGRAAACMDSIFPSLVTLQRVRSPPPQVDSPCPIGDASVLAAGLMLPGFSTCPAGLCIYFNGKNSPALDRQVHFVQGMS